MKMYENEGYYPYNELLERLEQINLGNRIKELLGERMTYMVYAKNENNYKESYVVLAITNQISTLGVEIATALKTLMPYSKECRKILLHDVINPYQIPFLTKNTDTDDFISKEPEKTMILEDENFIVGIVNGEEKVELYFFKK